MTAHEMGAIIDEVLGKPIGNPNRLTWLLGREPTTFEQFIAAWCDASAGTASEARSDCFGQDEEGRGNCHRLPARSKRTGSGVRALRVQ